MSDISTTITVLDTEITIEATYHGNQNWTLVNQDNYNNHTVEISTEGQSSIQFDFWASIMSPVISSDTDLIEALHCFVGDAVCGAMNHEDFCNDLGYDTDSIKAKETHDACVEYYNELETWGLDVYDLVNALQEQFGL